MGKYSVLDNPYLEKMVSDIITEIDSQFHPRTIILAGGFGRGEASVIEEGNKLRFLSDCEITLFSGKRVSRKAVNRLTADIYRRTRLEVVLHKSIMLRVFTSFPWLNRLAGKLWRPSILHYDLKHGSQVVSGENILKRIPDIKPEDIPLWEGVRLLFNRMAAALKYFPVNNERHDESIYWINKVILACQDALLLSVGQYHHSYQTRNIMFSRLLPSRFRELNRRLPEFSSLASMATSYKLNPARDVYTGKIDELWFDAAEICGHVFRYIIKQDMNINFDNYVEFQQKYLKHPSIRGKYYVGALSMPVLHNLITTLKMIAGKDRWLPSIKLMAKIRTPWQQIIYSMLPLVYFGLSRRGSTDKLLLKQARSTISLFKRLEAPNPNPVREWEYLGRQAHDLWRSLC